MRYWGFFYTAIFLHDMLIFVRPFGSYKRLYFEESCDSTLSRICIITSMFWHALLCWSCSSFNSHSSGFSRSSFKAIKLLQNGEKIRVLSNMLRWHFMPYPIDSFQNLAVKLKQDGIMWIWYITSNYMENMFCAKIIARRLCYHISGYHITEF